MRVNEYCFLMVQFVTCTVICIHYEGFQTFYDRKNPLMWLIVHVYTLTGIKMKAVSVLPIVAVHFESYVGKF